MNEETQANNNAIKQLADGMRRVANGRFDTRLEEYPEEPFRSIFKDFNQMAESLLSVEALRESFVSNVAHEFKTPLAYIQGYTTLLQDDNLSPEKLKDYVKGINDATRHLAYTIGNLLEISDLSRPSAKLETSIFSLDEQLRHSMAAFMPLIERKRLSYEIELETVDIDANEDLLEDVWTNLLSNALKHTDAGDTISLTLEKRSRQAIVRIADTGHGMTESQIEHAFDRFYQGEASHVGEGNGLGLAIVKAVVKKHGGTVNLESKLHKGTTFTVIIPLKQV